MFLLNQLPEQWILPDNSSAYRKKQLCEWIFRKRARSFDEMTNLPVEWRRQLAQKYNLQPLELTKEQGTETKKFLWKLHKGDFIESVLLPASPTLYGERADRHTLCISTQVGCAYGCKFCASGLKGWKRNLSPAEIVAQIIETERRTAQKINNIVFMGMGEPLANYKKLMTAVEMINSNWGLNIGARHITISTCGLVPQIKKLADDPRQLRLAVSLHGASDDVRSKIMPVNKKYPLEKLLETCRYYTSKKKKIITFEYILIKNLNDSPQQALLLAQHAQKLRAKINLIPYNTVESLSWQRPEEKTIRQFTRTLQTRGINTTLRREKGKTIHAACGQLALKTAL